MPRVQPGDQLHQATALPVIQPGTRIVEQQHLGRRARVNGPIRCAGRSSGLARTLGKWAWFAPGRTPPTRRCTRSSTASRACGHDDTAAAGAHCRGPSRDETSLPRGHNTTPIRRRCLQRLAFRRIPTSRHRSARSARHGAVAPGQRSSAASVVLPAAMPPATNHASPAVDFPVTTVDAARRAPSTLTSRETGSTVDAAVG